MVGAFSEDRLYYRIYIFTIISNAWFTDFNKTE